MLSMYSLVPVAMSDAVVGLDYQYITTIMAFTWITLLLLLTCFRQGNFATILYFTPLTIALATVLMVDWDKDCDKHLREW